MTPEAIIALIGALAPIANNLLDWIMKANATLKQSAEMTPDQEAQLDALVASLPTLPGYKVDPDPTPQGDPIPGQT